ncbi:MAG: hypothetical protein ACI305_10045 [Lepagella sp.]
MEHNAYNTTLGGWYNAPLFDYTKGRTTAALKVIAGCASCNGGVGGIFADPTDGTWCNLPGWRLPGVPSRFGLYIQGGDVRAVTL